MSAEPFTAGASNVIAEPVPFLDVPDDDTKRATEFK
jgi:hypothetical protein